MTSRAARFLEAALGAAGYGALAPLLKTAPGLEGYVVPRVVLAWLRAAPADCGFLPGLPHEFAMAKAEDGLTVVTDLGGQELAATACSPVEAAALAAYALGVAPPGPNLKDVDLARLGRTVDALVKAQRKKEPQTGVHHVATPPLAPAAPAPPGAPQQELVAAATKLPGADTRLPKPPRPKRARRARIGKAEASRPCRLCGDRQFGPQGFVGCVCFAALAKATAVTAVAGGYELEFGPDWDQEAVVTFLERIRG